MARAKKAAAVAPAAPEPEAIPGGTLQKGRKKGVTPPVPLQQTTLKEFLTPVRPEVIETKPLPAKKVPKKAAPVTPPPPPQEAKAPPPKKRAPKQTLEPLIAPLAIVTPNERVVVEETVNIYVKKLELYGKSYYLDSKKEKLYNLQFKYIGRYDKEKKEIIMGFYDSDQE
jgi:hypothetical protein